MISSRTWPAPWMGSEMTEPGEAKPQGAEPPADPGRKTGDLAITIGLIVYVFLLAVATVGEVFEVDAILKWFR